MNEIAKTATFVVVAAAVAVIAFFSRPSQPVSTPEGMVGQELFPAFTDPLAATSLEIMEFDEDTASVRPFKVAQVGGRWSIPSHDDYPADAQNQLADVAAGLMGLKVLEVASDNPGDQELYGVVDPDPEKLSAGARGVGMRVTMKDKDDKTLLSLVIGKEVPDRDGLRYIRRTGQDPTYTVALKTNKISTKFEDWIEKDLLKLSSWDIKDVDIRDYSVDELAGTLDMRSQLKLDYNDTGTPKWKLAEDLIFEQKKQDWVANPKPMTDAQDLDTTKLDDMRRALDDLKIVDVAKKPEGLSKDLRNVEGAQTLLNNREAVASLQDRGFYPARWKDHVELFSNKGEIRCLTDEGVNYILRFGNIAGSGSAQKKDESEKKADKKGESVKKDEKDEKDEDAKKDDSGDGGVNRFLFVMVEFDPSVIKKPELEPLPEKPKEDPKADPKEAEKKDGASSDKTDKTESEAADKDSQKAEAQKKYEEDVERINKENKRKQDEYDEKVKKGQDKLKELSDRFADWYYVISDDVYRKIHLTRDAIVKEKEKPKDEAAEKASPAAGHAPAAKVPAKPAAPAAATPKPAQTKPAEAKPAESKPDEKKPAEARPAKAKPAENPAAAEPEKKPAAKKP